MISVVIPVYNVEEYVEDCINSVISQTYKNIEAIIVNDGSTDKSLAICKQYAKKDKRVHIITQANQGLSAARNTGINFAKGEYITFVDSDDLIAPDMIEYLYLLLSKSHADMAVCQPEFVDIKGNRIIKEIKSSKRVVTGNKECMKEFFCSTDIGTVAWGKLYRTVHFKDVRYPVGKYYEDIFTTYLIIQQCEKIVVGDEKKYMYRQRNNSISKEEFSKKHLDAVEGAIVRKDYIERMYPEVLPYAKAKIVYVANQCSLKMAKAKEYDSQITNFLQAQYRNYELEFIKGNSSIVAKIYSILGWINLKLFIRAMGQLNIIDNKYYTGDKR